MPNSIQLDRQGPDWPLGLITVATSGTPVGIMSVVDPTGTAQPHTATPSVPPGTYEALPEYTVAAQQIIFQAVKSTGPVVANTGAIYVVRQKVGSGTGNKADTGSIVAIIQPGGTFILGSSAQVVNVFSPYRYSIDADTNGDGCLVTLLIQ